MKKMMMTLMALLMMGMLTNNVYAQDNEGRRPIDERTMQKRERTTRELKEQLNPEQLTEQRANRMARDLALDDASAKRFIETYCRYQAERRALFPERDKKTKSAARQGEADKLRKEVKPCPTEAECKQQLVARMERDQKVLDLRKKYYNEYSKFLTQKQIARIVQMDKKHKKPILSKGRGEGKHGLRFPREGRRPANPRG